MRYPPRLSHMATKNVLIARLLPTYAEAHEVDDEEARTRLESALSPGIIEQLLAATWQALLGGTKRLDENGLLEKVSGSLGDRPLRPGRTVSVTPGWSAFMLLLDLEVGTASEMARRALDNDDGRARLQAGVAEVGRFMAAELTR